MDRRSTIVARHLLRCGCRNGDVVAVAMDRQSDLIAVLLGILKAGAVYLPLDKQNPAAATIYSVRYRCQDIGKPMYLASLNHTGRAVCH